MSNAVCCCVLLFDAMIPLAGLCESVAGVCVRVTAAVAGATPAGLLLLASFPAGALLVGACKLEDAENKLLSLGGRFSEPELPPVRRPCCAAVRGRRKDSASSRSSEEAAFLDGSTTEPLLPRLCGGKLADTFAVMLGS